MVVNEFDEIRLLSRNREAAPAVKSLNAPVPRDGRVVQEYLLGGDASKGPTEYKYTY
jgi:hypothetical protein